MPIRIVTDSTCDLPASLAIHHSISVVPCYINMNGKSYLDGIDLSRQEFYTNLPASSTVPTTSSPGIGTFVQVYQQLADEGASGIISIHISSNLSNIYNIACLAAQQISQIPVRVVDSGQLTLGTGVLALAAAEAGAADKSLLDTIALLEDMIPRTHCFASLETLEFLRRSGRISGLQTHLGTLLQIKPILRMNHGEIIFEKVRTNGKSIQRLLELVSKLGRLEQLSLVHTHTLPKVEHLRQQALSFFPADKTSLCVEVTPAIGAHIGPGAIGFVCVAAS